MIKLRTFGGVVQALCLALVWWSAVSAYSNRVEVDPRNRYVSTIPAETTSGSECAGDCIDGKCIVYTDGELQPCRNVRKPRIVYYTGYIMQQEHPTCLSACMGNISTWCFVDKIGTWDFCNKEWTTSANSTTAGYPKTIRITDWAPPARCISPCEYSADANRNLCKVDKVNTRNCAPYGFPLPPHVPKNSDNSVSVMLPACVRPTILTDLIMRKKRTPPNKHTNTTNSDQEPSECLAAQNPDRVDRFRAPVSGGIFQEAPRGSVATDAVALRDMGETDNNPTAPLTSITTLFNRQLNLNFPVVVRARIDLDAIQSTVLPRPSNGIQLAVPALASALRTIRYTHRGTVYDLGHMIGYGSGGPDADYNCAPQTTGVNRGVWLSMENHIRQWVNLGSPTAFVEMLIVVYYDADETYLPIAFGVNLVYFHTAGVVASVCNDLLFFNMQLRRSPRGPRSVVDSLPPLFQLLIKNNATTAGDMLH
ncbi:uncharacterized protein LOC142977999 [Anticarsia gemmatalis]|uniref:uncharacterized protein LOC142977999 n=1 Tax=Anticarsia gemmatalis TaxID=129554 RepID=UPI003F769E15